MPVKDQSKINIMTCLTNIVLLVFLAALNAGRGKIYNKKDHIMKNIYRAISLLNLMESEFINRQTNFILLYQILVQTLAPSSPIVSK